MEKTPVRIANRESVARGNNGRYVLRLYIAGTGARSTRAITNIKKICKRDLNDRYDLKVIDIFQHPEAAREAQIVAVPTLVKELRLALRRFIGHLSDTDKVILE